MMRSAAICMALTFLGAVFAAQAGAPLPHWTAPGWYQMKQGWVFDEFWIYAGPFPTERVCRATLPVKPHERYRCEHLATRPMWDIP
jgi:hypothetical protein